MLVEVTGVSHRFPARPFLFTDLSFSAPTGCLTALTGPSGSGKSTLLGIVAGLIEPSLGSVYRPEGARVVWAFQNPVGTARRRVRDHVELPILAAGASRSEAGPVADGWLDRFGLGSRADEPFRHLSGGEGQRLMLARAAAAEPEILLVDEPTAQLDSVSAREVTAVLGHLASSGAVVLVATHDAAVMRECDQQVTLSPEG